MTYKTNKEQNEQDIKDSQEIADTNIYHILCGRNKQKLILKKIKEINKDGY